MCSVFLHITQKNKVFSLLFSIQMLSLSQDSDQSQSLSLSFPQLLQSNVIYPSPELHWFLPVTVLKLWF
jgi:hypothetical protein